MQQRKDYITFLYHLHFTGIETNGRSYKQDFLSSTSYMPHVSHRSQCNTPPHTHSALKFKDISICSLKCALFPSIRRNAKAKYIMFPLSIPHLAICVTYFSCRRKHLSLWNVISIYSRTFSECQNQESLKNSFRIEISLPGRNLPSIAPLRLRQTVILQMKISRWKDNSPEDASPRLPPAFNAIRRPTLTLH